MSTRRSRAASNASGGEAERHPRRTDRSSSAQEAPSAPTRAPWLCSVQTSQMVEKRNSRKAISASIAGGCGAAPADPAVDLTAEPDACAPPASEASRKARLYT
eukprot:scaffold189505_cov29-Tisochrysis_lutea.AAC.1